MPSRPSPPSRRRRSLSARRADHPRRSSRSARGARPRRGSSLRTKDAGRPIPSRSADREAGCAPTSIARTRNRIPSRNVNTTRGRRSSCGRDRSRSEEEPDRDQRVAQRRAHREGRIRRSPLTTETAPCSARRRTGPARRSRSFRDAGALEAARDRAARGPISQRGEPARRITSTTLPTAIAVVRSRSSRRSAMLFSAEGSAARCELREEDVGGHRLVEDPQRRRAVGAGDDPVQEDAARREDGDPADVQATSGGSARRGPPSPSG
jgi:hypothetical protein